MLKTDNARARRVFRALRREDPIADHYISFIHRNFPNEEKNQFTIDELRKVADMLGIKHSKQSKDTLYSLIRTQSGYQDLLRAL